MELKTLKKLSIPEAHECIYTPCYCEENVWKLCEFVAKEQPELIKYCYVVFISNENQRVPLWNQRAGNADNLTVWDYHVILIHTPPDQGPALVYDLDSTLPFPVDFTKYGCQTLKSDFLLKPEFHRKFRVIPGEIFLNKFTSDRSRMRNPDGTWIKKPPPYSCIQTSESTNNLEEFISMKAGTGVGEVMNLNQFIEKYFPD
ncbi:protein N-terminal glutamine amidohydrolase-like [Limulus polyphemus]|uniref:Protein N-terminal glutamine amidohydrolase n=1 Tax=Limulus polyphemus TaxID=6850 RepID=A0ABM1B566_LIMPO|nr:protein N-terminal glutamine amidohydrolase-like [Limulus polyphemus]XP_013775050.1 protein N-terminal glutamine amidohydrolase-like [Limulus polyphemus]XP_013775051.1 protein N-terminal glutamine amidohydrolase-like [Limulus polyphemus]XP_022242209.1 protein N-terminal glutamine amidohydrolase-like [Limulus polyphemus]XP_022242210.1 protein N-terminal glutamine amidohydrolase-like [Limulus polyphemus]